MSNPIANTTLATFSYTLPTTYVNIDGDTNRVYGDRKNGLLTVVVMQRSSKRYIESILAISYRIDIVNKNIEID